jgi:hypothetical protein
VDVSTFAEFTASIHANIFVETFWSVAGEPAVDPIDRRGLRCESTTKDPPTEVVGQQDIAGFAVHANKSIVPNCVPTLLDHETEVDGQTLVACRCSHGGFCSCWDLAEFRGETNGASFYFGWDLEMWHPFYKTVHLRQPTKINMPEALVP